jgi:hypothetical protein
MLHKKSPEVRKTSYKPHKEAARALLYVKQKIDALPYTVSNRWAFYRILQDLGYKKSAYKNWIKWQSRARKSLWNGYAPDTFEDDTRETEWTGPGYDDFSQWLDSLKYDEPIYDAFKLQGKIVVCCFEARAMQHQFQYYMGRYRISLIPFAGDYTIEPKWRVAKQLESWYQAYELPIIVLYFGDCDKKGRKIPESAFKDIRKWCQAPIDIRPCGLTLEQAHRYNLPENPERPGQYQWEALDDPQAAKIILGALDKVWDRRAIEALEEDEKRDTEKWHRILAKLKKES